MASVRRLPLPAEAGSSRASAKLLQATEDGEEAEPWDALAA